MFYQSDDIGSNSKRAIYESAWATDKCLECGCEWFNSYDLHGQRVYWCKCCGQRRVAA